MHKASLLWKLVTGVALLSATLRSHVSGSYGSFDALLIAGSMAPPPGSFLPSNEHCGALLMASPKSARLRSSVCYMKRAAVGNKTAPGVTRAKRSACEKAGR